MYTEERLLGTLALVTEELGKSPTVDEYREFIEGSEKKFPSVSTYIHRFGSWNDAKDAADLEVYPHGANKYTKDPAEHLTGFLWYRSVKEDNSCFFCDEEYPAALAFHHVDPTEKDDGVGSLASNGYSAQRVKEEAEKCALLCKTVTRNCTRGRSLCLPTPHL